MVLLNVLNKQFNLRYNSYMLQQIRSIYNLNNVYNNNNKCVNKNYHNDNVQQQIQAKRFGGGRKTYVIKKNLINTNCIIFDGVVLSSVNHQSSSVIRCFFSTNNFLKNFSSSRYLSTTSTKTMSESMKTNPKLVSIAEAKRFIIDCFSAVKTPREHGEAMANLLIDADYRGHFSHGMNRLEMYLNDINKNPQMSSVKPKIIQETVATAWVDGNNGLGAVIGNFCMDLAIEKARNVGVGWVSVKRSNHYGIAGYYTIRAEKQGMIGISMTNTSPFMSPTRSSSAALGTNPISVAVPGTNDDSFVLDMATTAVAVGKIEIQRRKCEPCPVGWAQDTNGQPTTDANVAFSAGCLMPLGGSELTSGYKGYGLGTMVEMLCGVLAGANYATNIRKWSLEGSDDEANLGQLFVAINPNCFCPGFSDRVTDLNGILRNMPQADPMKPVLVAGDPERIHMAKIDSVGGIEYHANQLQSCSQLATKLNVKPLIYN